MFQKKNWSSDENLDVKRREFLTLVENEETEVPVKKRKLGNEQQTTIQSNINKEDSSKIGLKFNGSQKSCFENTMSSESDENLQSMRKKMILNLLSRRNVQDLPDSTDDCSNSEIELQKSKFNSYPNKSLVDNTIFGVNDCNDKSIIRKNDDKGEKELEHIEKQMNEKINDNAQEISLNSRRSLLMQHLKPCGSSSKEFLNNMKPPSSISIIEKQSNKKTTLVRKFPGPAGLLPDFIDPSVLPTSYLKNLEDSKEEDVQDQKDNNLTEYCSQNTKNLFSEGTWQTMLNDLPGEFLKNYQIAEIKKTASAKQHQCIKIPFLAGIIESIDYSHENPSIVLKDFTDRIEGTMHADILTKYSGSLDKNVAILLQNVGLLCISGAFTVHKYHILISPTNLLAIYSHIGDIVRTPHMELLKNKFSTTGEFNLLHLSKLQDNNYDIEETNCNNVNISQEDSLSSEKDGKKISKNQSHNSNIDSNSSEKHLLPSSQTFSSNKNIIQDKDDVKNAAVSCTNKSSNISLQNIDKMMIKENTASLKSNVVVKENKENKENKKNISNNESLSQEFSVDASWKYLQDENKNCSDISKNNFNKNELSGLEKLAMFNKKYVISCEKNVAKSKDLPTETVLENSNNKSDNKEMPSINSNWTKNILCDTADDSDDEMLSQLDVDCL